MRCRRKVKIGAESFSVRIADIPQFAAISSADCVNCAECCIVCGIVSDQNLIRDTGLAKQALQLFRNVFFSAAGGNGNSDKTHGKGSLHIRRDIVFRIPSSFMPMRAIMRPSRSRRLWGGDLK